MMNHELTPYDTGLRLEPKPWVDADGVTGDENRRPAGADDCGRVDFEDIDMTAATIWIEPDGSNGYVLHVSAHAEHVSIVLDGRRMEVAP